MNSRIREPLIWPPNRNETSKETSSDFKRVAFGGVHGADGAADALGSLEHGRRVHQGFDLAGVGIFQALGQGREHRLADRKIAGAGDRHDPLAGLAEDVELAESRNVVEAGIGARVRDHDEAVSHQNSAAIGHSQSPNPPKFVGAKLVANFTGASNPNSPAAACAEWAEAAIERRAGGRRRTTGTASIRFDRTLPTGRSEVGRPFERRSYAARSRLAMPYKSCRPVRGASTRNASSTGTPSAVTSRFVSAAMPTMAIISAYSASVMPLARAPAVCE